LVQEKVINGRVWSLRDITSRKKVEDELRRSEERFYAVSETAGDLFFSILRDGTIGYVNELAAMAFTERLITYLDFIRLIRSERYENSGNVSEDVVLFGFHHKTATSENRAERIKFV
jgi:hypothetical protein